MNINYFSYHAPEKLKNFLQWSERLGPVTFSVMKKTSPPEPEWWVGSAKLVKSPIGLFYTKNISASAGTSIYPEEALVRTVGETIERYSSMNSHLIDTIYPQIIDEGLGFVRCGDFETCQPSFKRNGIPNEVEHSVMKKLADDSSVYIPYEYVHLGFMRFYANVMHTTPISTGCSFFYDINTSIWKSICEVVERDAMMRLWYARETPVKISLTGIKDEALRLRKKRIYDAGLKLHLFEISSIINIPVFYAIVEGAEFPYFCVGASSDSDPFRAAIKAIDEAISIRVMANWNHFEATNAHDLTDFTWVNKLEKHMELYANWKNSEAFDFLLKQNIPEVNISMLSSQKDWLHTPSNYDDLTNIAKHFQKRGFDIYWKDITIPEVKEFGVVTKVVIPQMIPLSQAYSCRWLEPFSELYNTGKLNPYPHPFS